MIDLESLPMWLATISPTKVNAFTREKLVRYQREAKAVLSAYFLGTSADMPELAAEFAGIKARLSHVEKVASIYHSMNDTLTESLSVQSEQLEVFMNPFLPMSGDGEYLYLSKLWEIIDMTAPDKRGRPLLFRDQASRRM